MSDVCFSAKLQKDTLEQKIRKLDAAQAEAILRKDFQALDELCAKDFTVNNPRGEISKGNEAVKELIRSGVINNASFVREIELVLIHGKTIIVMGHETLVQMKILRRQVKPCVAATQTFG